MLYANTGVGPREVVDGEGAALEGVVWLDLMDPTEAERGLVERVTGLRVPGREDLAEIESSSRLSTERGALYLSAPTHVLDAEGVSHSSPLGFVLSERRLVTVRYAALPVFEQCGSTFHLEGVQGGAPDGVVAFLWIMEAIVDRMADVLEHIGVELDLMSRRVFRPEGASPARTDVQLRATLRGVGRAGDRLSNLRDSLVGVQRVVGYVAETARWIRAEDRPRFLTLRQDTVSLADYDVQLSNKVQFLLDATLGFINIEQNNGIKVLTVVSVVGVPPTLMASIYGMNFHNMPELSWVWGYQYGLLVIVLSGLLPLVWFRRKGWI